MSQTSALYSQMPNPSTALPPTKKKVHPRGVPVSLGHLQNGTLLRLCPCMSNSTTNEKGQGAPAPQPW